MHFRCWRPHSFISCVQNTWWWVFVLIGKDVTGILGNRLLKSLVIRSENNLPIDANRIGSNGSSIGYDWWVRAQNAFLLSAFTVIVERGFFCAVSLSISFSISLSGFPISSALRDGFNCRQRNKWSVPSVIGGKKGVMPNFFAASSWPFVLTWHPITPCHRPHL